MRIGYLCLEPTQSRQHISGYAVHLNAMIGAFEAAGHEVGVIVLGEWRGHAQPAASARDNGSGGNLKSALKRVVPGILWETARDLRVRRWDREYRERYRKFLKEFNPDVIYEQIAFNAESGRLLADELCVPRMAELHAPMVEERMRDGRRSLYAPRARRIEMRNLETADRIRVVSSPLKEYLVERGIAPGKIIVQPNGTDTTRFHPGAGDGERVRRELELGDRLVFGFTGSFFRWHRIDTLIEAFAAVQKECPETALLIVGDGEDSDRLRTLASELGVGGHVRFTGNVPHDEIIDYYAAMDVCCMVGTNWYGSPLKLFEYGGLRKAIVAPDEAPVREVMTPDQDGLLVPVGNANATADAMRRLCLDEDLRQTLAQSFHEKVRSRYDWAHVAGNILRAMEEIRSTRSQSPMKRPL